MSDETERADKHLISDLDAARRVDVRDRTESELTHTGSQNVTGYRPQPSENLALVNAVKEMERNFASWLGQVYLSAGVSLDPREVAMARTSLQYAFYHLNRAVFQPADPIGDAVAEGLRR